MTKIYRWFLRLLPLTILFGACSSKQTPDENVPLADATQVRFIDSLTASSNNPNISQALIADVKQSVQHFAAEKDEATQMFLTMGLAYLYNINGETDSALHYIEKALPYYEKNTYIGVSEQRLSKALFLCYFIYGESLMIEGENITKANYYLSKASAFSMQPGVDTIIDKRYKITALQYAITTNRFCKQYEQALHYGKVALQLIASSPKDNYGAHSFRIISEVANCYSETGQFDSSKYYIARLELLARKINKPAAVHDLYSVNAAYYYYNKQYDSSLKYSLLATESMNQKDLGALTAYSNNLGLCVRLKRKAEAQHWYNLAADRYQSLDIIDASDKIAYLENKIPYDFLYGSKETAERDYWQLATLKEQEYSTERLKMFATIESEYNVALKEKKIAALNTQNEIAKSRQKSLTLIAILTALLMGAVIVAAILLSRHRKLKQEKEKALLQQQLLRTQMEPHFIFNTLSALQSYVRFDEKEKTLKYLNQFSRLLRSSLELSRESFVPLTEEIETLQNYLSLQKMRYENAFSYNINCQEDIYGIMIPPMLIQPFVENAIVHGIEPNDQKGIITIDFVIKGSSIQVTITDNGKGLQNKPTQPQKHKSLATAISRERLAMMTKESGGDAGITIGNGPLKGTIVVLTIPISKETKNE